MRRELSMQVCPNCHHQNRVGVVFCEQCGASLVGEAPLGTKHIPYQQPESLPDSGAGLGSDFLREGTLLRIEFKGAEPLTVAVKPELIFGRRDPSTGTRPDIDLTPFAGYRLGVSRRHAALRQTHDSRLDLWDLGSSNGTYLNGVRLIAHRPNRVHDGDEIQLGQMICHIYFQQPAETVAEDSDSESVET
jgi:hypothetical protein